MAADTDQPASDQPYTWLHCAGCGKGLWKQFADHLEMTLSPRGGEKRLINVSLEAAPTVSVKCEKCGRLNVPAAEPEPEE